MTDELLVIWSKSLRNGCAEVRYYPKSAGSYDICMGYDAASGRWFYVNERAVLLKRPDGKCTHWTRETNTTQIYDCDPGSDCTIEGAFPAVAILDLLKRPELLTSVHQTTNGSLEVVATYPQGTRCSLPPGNTLPPKQVVYALGDNGHIQQFITNIGSKDQVRTAIEYEKSCSTIPIAAEINGGAFAVRSIVCHSSPPENFFDMQRLQSLSAQNTASFRPLVPVEPDYIAQENQDGTYNPLAGYSLPLVISGIFLCLLSLFVWWKRKQ